MSNRLTTAAVALAIAVGLLANTFYVASPRSVVLVTQFGKIVAARMQPGLYARIPLLQSLERFDSREQTLDNDGLPRDFTTADHRDVNVSYYVKWRLVDPVTYYTATGGQELSAQDRLSAIVKDGMQNQLVALRADDIGVSGLDGLTAGLNRDLHDRLSQLGIELVDARVITVALPKDMTDARYARMRAERKRIASELRAKGAESADTIRAQADSQAEGVLADADLQSARIKGAAEAHASHIYADAYSKDPEFFSFFRSLDAYRSAFQSNQDVLVLKPDSEFFRYFSSSKPSH